MRIPVYRGEAPDERLIAEHPELADEPVSAPAEKQAAIVRPIEEDPNAL